MAFSTFEDITTTAPTASTVINMSLPATVNNDDLLVMIVGVRADTITTSLTGWTHLGSSGGSQTDMAVWWRKGVSGDSGGTVTVDFDGTASANASGAVYRFSGTADPDSIPPEAILNKQDTDGTSKDCLSLTPSGWSTDDTTWIAAFFHRTDGTVSTYPTSNNGAGSAYTNTTTALNGTDAHLSGYAHINRNAASENPSDFVTSKTADWSTCTVAIPPSGASSGGTTVNANLESLTLTEFAASINAETAISATLESITITENSANIALGVDIAAALESITLTENQANINAGVDIAANLESITVTENAANINAATDVAGNTESITLTEYAASINAGTDIQTNLESITLTENAATIQTGSGVVTITENIQLTEFSAGINAGVDISAGLESITVTEYGTTINAATNITGNTGSITVTENAATIALTPGDIGINAGLEQLSITAYSGIVSGSAVALPLGEIYRVKPDRYNWVVRPDKFNFKVN